MSLEEMKRLEAAIDAKASAYHYIGTEDRHIINLFHWVDIIQKLKDEVRSSEMDGELEDSLSELSRHLVAEVGHRMCILFP